MRTFIGLIALLAAFSLQGQQVTGKATPGVAAIADSDSTTASAPSDNSSSSSPNQSSASTSQSGSGSASTSTQAGSSSGQGTSDSAKPDRGTYIPRISGGLSLSVLGLSLIPNGTSNVTNSPTVSTAYSTTGASQRLGYGLTAQVMITDHIGFVVSGLLRRIGYQFDTTVSTTTNTIVGSELTPITTTTGTHEDTRARLVDIPALLRYYSKDRHTPGGRWFLEGGGALREAGSIRTSLSSTDTGGNVTCCTDTPTTPAHKTSHGFVGGAGAEFIDPFGIHVVPEVRYTRWMNPTFSNFSTVTQRNEVSAGVSLTY